MIGSFSAQSSNRRLSRPGRGKSWLGAAVLVLATFLAFSPALTAGLIWDDDFHFAGNPHMRGLHGLFEIWTSRAGLYYPLTLTSFWIMDKLVGQHPLPYHFVTIALHAANAVLLWMLLARRNVRGGWFAAALFALHPVQVESVAWVTELKNTQSGFFFLLSLLCAERSGLLDGREPERHWFAGAALGFLFALLSKSSTVMLPFVFVLLLWWRGQLSISSIRPLVPFFFLAAMISGWTIWEQRFSSGAIGFEWSQGLGFRTALAGHAVWFYFFKLVWPEPLIFFYPKWAIDAGLASYVPPATLLGLFAALWAMRRRWAHAVFLALLYFVIMLFPVMGFFNVYFMRYAFVADHFQYLACIGIFALFAAGVSFLPSSIRPPVQSSILLLFALLAFQHAHAFHDERTLWLDTLKKNPAAWMVHNNLGASLQGEGDIDGALAHYQAAVKYNPDHYEALSNLANILADRGDLDVAIGYYERALKLRPDFPQPYVNLGLIYEKQGQPDLALQNYKAALSWNPGFWEAWVKIASLQDRQGLWMEAVAAWKQALALRQANPQAASDFFYRHAYELMTNGNEAAAQVYLGEVKKLGGHSL